jgi:hypothetical protein
MTRILALFAVAVVLGCFGISDVSAQATASGGVVVARDEEPLQMAIDSGLDQPKLWESYEGIPEPVVLVVGQPVEVTLQFPGSSIGGTITVSPLDGGQIDLDGPVTISSDGKVVFHYQSAALPGLYRLQIAGAQERQISFYAVDPNRPTVLPPSDQ